MYQHQEFTEETFRKLQESEEDIPYKTGPNNRIVLAQKCPHCRSFFYARRRNHKYCSNSCRVAACYKRNEYEYIPGSYKKKKTADKSKPTEKISFNLEGTQERPIQHTAQAQNPVQAGENISIGGVGKSVLGTAAVQLFKFVVHDLPMKKKLNQIIEILDSKVSEKDALHFLGPRRFQTGKIVTLFVDKQSKTYLIRNEKNQWSRLISEELGIWQPTEAPSIRTVTFT